MILWAVLTVLVTLAGVGLVLPLMRPRATPTEGATPVQILKGQLAELDAQAESGAVPANEAARLRLEIERRMLAEAREAKAPARPLGKKALLRLAFGLAGVVALGGAGLYAVMGRPELPGAGQPAAATAAAPLGADHPGGDIETMITQLRARVQTNPSDAESWRMLGWSYFQTSRFGEAAEAYGRAGSLDGRNADHPSAQGESLVQAAGGQVTPAAASAFRAALAIDPNEPRARYFLAVLKDQNGDPDGAMADWIAVVNNAPEGAPWVGEVRRFVEDVARERGIDISARLRPASSGPAVAAPGPTAQDVAAAERMAPAERDDMVRGMVEGLEARLRTQPNDAEGWVRLMRARMVLGETDAAARAYRDGRAAFSASPADQTRLAEAARGLGVPGA